jgi:mRNA-degrading endonuclease RelE of RelBE toxin-antitoxin system
MIIPSRTFQKQFDRLEAPVQRRVIEKVEELEANLRA